ncbi:MAG: hypothetical protein MJA27_12040 [Pseudanabaenales cyanobacterium]|nr:hypothetical protein [Pseudanabaenales cyanobacterium]
MDIVTLEQKYQNLYTPTFEILVEGQDILKAGVEVISVNVDNTLDGADTFSFTVFNAFDTTQRKILWFEGLFSFGKEVEIKFGYAKETKTLMIGLITSVKVDFPSGSPPQMEVSGFDYSFLMMKEKKPRSWKDTTDSNVAKSIAAEYKLEISPDGNNTFTSKEPIEDSEIEFEQIVKQEKESDFEFLKRLAERNYYELFVFNKTLYFRKPAYKSDPVVNLEWNKSLVSFSPELNIAEYAAQVSVTGQDTLNQKNIVATAKLNTPEIKKQEMQQTLDILLNFITLNFITRSKSIRPELLREQVKQPVASEKHAENLAKSILLKRNEERLKGNGESIGVPDILAGANIELKGLGSQFSQTYYIEKTNHTISSSGYRTTFSVKQGVGKDNVKLTSETSPLS